MNYIFAYFWNILIYVRLWASTAQISSGQNDKHCSIFSLSGSLFLIIDLFFFISDVQSSNRITSVIHIHCDFGFQLPNKQVDGIIWWNTFEGRRKEDRQSFIQDSWGCWTGSYQKSDLLIQAVKILPPKS